MAPGFECPKAPSTACLRCQTGSRDILEQATGSAPPSGIAEPPYTPSGITWTLTYPPPLSTVSPDAGNSLKRKTSQAVRYFFRPDSRWIIYTGTNWFTGIKSEGPSICSLPLRAFERRRPYNILMGTHVSNYNSKHLLFWIIHCNSAALFAIDGVSCLIMVCYWYCPPEPTTCTFALVRRNLIWRYYPGQFRLWFLDNGTDRNTSGHSVRIIACKVDIKRTASSLLNPARSDHETSLFGVFFFCQVSIMTCKQFA